jgi:hypothetical protein
MKPIHVEAVRNKAQRYRPFVLERQESPNLRNKAHIFVVWRARLKPCPRSKRALEKLISASVDAYRAANFRRAAEMEAIRL